MLEYVNKIVEFFNSELIAVWMVFVLMVVEYWLGKTDLVKPGSTLEVVLSGVKKVVGFLKGVVGKK
jgi:hypothetical protein